MARVHIIDPQLVGEGGHYLNHDRQLIVELQRRGLDVSLYARKGCSVECSGVKPVPIFSFEIFQEAATDPQVWAIENFQTINQAFLAELGRIDTSALARDDLIYFPNLLQNQLYAVALWIARVPEERRPFVAVMLRFLNHAMDYVQNRANKELIALYYRYAGQALYSAQPRSMLCADTRELAQAYQKIIGRPVLELPNPMDVSDLVAGSESRAPNPRPVIVYQGHTSPLRGFQFLPEIIQRCAKLTPKPRFLIQVQNRDTAKATGLGPTLQQLDQLAGPDVVLSEGPLSATAYFDMLATADIVLLPYSPTFYGHGSSGVFTESASLGKVIVVSGNTMPARHAREYGLGVVVAQPYTAQAMTDAVAEAVRKLPILQRQSQTAAARYRNENCARAFWDKLLKHAMPVQTLRKAASESTGSVQSEPAIVAGHG